MEPGAGEAPVAFGGGDGDVEQGGAFLEGQAGEVAELYEFSFAGVVGGEAVEGVVDGEQFIAFPGRGDFEAVEVEVVVTAAVFDALFAAGAVHEDAAHRFGGGAEKVCAVFKLAVAEAQPCLVDERRGLEGVAGALRGHFDGGDPTELLIHQRQELLPGPGLLRAKGLKDSGHAGIGGVARRIHATLLPNDWSGAIPH